MTFPVDVLRFPLTLMFYPFLIQERNHPSRVGKAGLWGEGNLDLNSHSAANELCYLGQLFDFAEV